MSGQPAIPLRCPICKKVVESQLSDFPFCSDRCRTIDLGKWASGEYVIQSPAEEGEEDIRNRVGEDGDHE